MPSPDSTGRAEMPKAIADWHAFVADPTRETLHGLLAPEAVFHSPAVHTPQPGRDLTAAYLWAAVDVLGPNLTYVEQWYGERSAVLRFAATVGSREVDGVDLVHWDDDGRIVDFAVMVRPYQGLQALIEAMRARLEV